MSLKILYIIIVYITLRRWRCQFFLWVISWNGGPDSIWLERSLPRQVTYRLFNVIIVPLPWTTSKQENPRSFFDKSTYTEWPLLKTLKNSLTVPLDDRRRQTVGDVFGLRTLPHHGRPWPVTSSMWTTFSDIFPCDLGYSFWIRKTL